MQYRNLTNLSSKIRENIWRIPKVDAVVGIPRSGMIAASMIATLTNQPLLCASELFKSSFPLKPKHGGRWENMGWPETVLLVDDSISGGQTMKRVAEQIRNQHSSTVITRLAVFRKPDSPDICISFETVPGPRLFEWNWFRHPYIKRAVLDIDGVISTPTKPGWREQGYPLWIPKYKVRAVATGRWEDDRVATEAWLAKHGVRYGKLYMSNKDQHARTTKVKAMLETGAMWMVESSDKQARYIHVRTGKPVLCTDTNTMI